MADIWYPGRPPLKTPEIIEGLTHYLGALQSCADQQTTLHLEQAERVCDHLMLTLQDEAADCLGSDTDINDLIKLLPRSFDAARLCARHGAWDEIDEIVHSIDVIRWSLIAKLDELTEGRYDGRQPTSSETPR